jgi:hypothetical protein
MVALKGKHLSLGFARNTRELRFLAECLLERGHITYPKEAQVRLSEDEDKVEFESSVCNAIRVTEAGWLSLSTRTPRSSSTAFVAMWFGEEMASAWYEGMQPAIEQDCFWRAERIDLEEHNEDIVDRILGDIRVSRFLVADFTGQRNGVYFEAGFALGLGVPVIWSCRKDWIGKAHFDTSHFSHVVWETSEELREKLANRIRATIGEGNYEPPNR